MTNGAPFYQSNVIDLKIFLIILTRSVLKSANDYNQLSKENFCFGDDPRLLKVYCVNWY